MEKFQMRYAIPIALVAALAAGACGWFGRNGAETRKKNISIYASPGPHYECSVTREAREGHVSFSVNAKAKKPYERPREASAFYNTATRNWAAVITGIDMKNVSQHAEDLTQIITVANECVHETFGGGEAPKYPRMVKDKSFDARDFR